MMLEEDIEDTHLCIKCNTTIVGLENYIQHRKTNCTNKPTTSISHDPPHDHQFRSFDFAETPNYHKPEEVEKSSKSLTDTYDIPYDLGADVFFSSLELQSSSRRTISNPAPVSTGGKHGPTSKILTRKATAALLSHHEPSDGWISPRTNTENLMQAVHDLSGTKKCDNVFMVPFQHDSPEPSEEEDDDDEDYEGSGPPASHTGGKWKPESTMSPSILRNSPAWDDRSQWDIDHHHHHDEKSSKNLEADDFDHDLIPPPGHTKGKWVPGTKIIKLDYKEEVEVEKIFSDQFWCNTCNRKLATKLLYERHIKSALHLKRSEPEQELEQAPRRLILPKFSERLKKRSVYLNDSIYLAETPTTEDCNLTERKTRKRRRYFIKCETCKMRLPKSLLGKHLISHYHYRRMSRNPSKSFDLVLRNIDKIVYQAPYQCRSCRFYTNTHDDFIDHWNTEAHADIVEGPGQFYCNFCKFECEDNNQMRRHLLGQDHKEVILAINRSCPIIIGKRVTLECPKCKYGFRYNIELRRHSERCTFEPAGTASNAYQSKFICELCNATHRSKLSLQKHMISSHNQPVYYCSVCKIEFEKSVEAKKHRNSTLHRVNAASLKNEKDLKKVCTTCGAVLKNLIEFKEHMQEKHPEVRYACPYCGEKFLLPQELGRHVRDKICQASTSKVSENQDNLSEQQEAGHPNQEWNCLKCSYSSHLKAELLYHEILHSVGNTEENVKIACSLCQKKFRKYSLRYHLRQHTNERLFECSYCSMRFSRKYNLKTHLDNVHGKGEKQTNVPKSKQVSFQCDACGKCFYTKYGLKQHSVVHNERDSKFKCNTEGCIYVARNASDLKGHWGSHSSEKIFECDVEGCSYKGKTTTLLKRHMKFHVPVSKTFDCPHCEFKARIPGHLKRHLRIHTGEKPYKCPYCDFHCNTSENLRKHVLTTSIHAGRSLYECQYCDPTEFFKTNFQKEYRTHLIVSHQVESQFLTI